MRFADADVLALEGGNPVPPLEVRLDLRPGDKVGLYEEVRPASMGAGYSPIEAVILGSTEPGWFVGQTEDGREITFHAGNIADVEMGSPSMGGIFDWFKPPPLPGSQLPIALPSAPVPQEKGLIAKLKNLFPAKTGEEGPRKSIFDIFKKPTSGPLVARESGTLVPSIKKPGFFSIFSRESKVVVPFSQQVADLAIPKGPNPLAPYIEKFQEVFKIIPKSPEPPPKAPGQQELFASIFQPVKEGEQREFGEIFKVFTPSEVQPIEEVMPPDLPQNLHRAMKVLPMPRRTSLFPSVEETARGFMSLYNPIEDLWDVLREVREKPVWKDYIKKYGFAKEQFESLGTCGGPPTVFEEVSSFMHIPWEEFRKRAKIADAGGDNERWLDDDDVWMEIVFPATEIMSEALNLIKPPDLPGTFSFEREVHGDTFCTLLIQYTEGEEKPGAHEEWKKENAPQEEEEEIPENYEQWKKDNNAESPEEVVAQLKVDDIDPRKAREQLVSEVNQLISQAEALDPESGTYDDDLQELLSQIQYRKEIAAEIDRETAQEQQLSPQELAEFLQSNIEAEEQSILKLTEQLEKLSPGNKEFRDIADQLKASLEESKEHLRALTEELSNLPGPGSPRTPSGKKKAAKRGKKKGKR